MPALANKIGFNAAACYEEIERTADRLMTMLAEKLQEIMKREIMTNGNGSPGAMKAPTAGLIKEILHDVIDGNISIDVGIDPAMSRDFSDKVFVKMSVVIFGNHGPLTTKPGQQTWKKHIENYSESTAKTVYNLPAGFSQPNKYEDMMKNIHSQIKIYVDEFSNAINSTILNGSFFRKFITVS